MEFTLGPEDINSKLIVRASSMLYNLNTEFLDDVVMAKSLHNFTRTVICG